MADARRVNERPFALNGGEDYELLVAISSDAVEVATAKLKEHFGVPFTVVGEITETSGIMADGRPLKAKGWDHFA